MQSRTLDVLADRVLELGPKPDAAGPYRNFKLTRDAEGIAWLLFDRDGASANTLSSDVMEEFDRIIGELESATAGRSRDPLGKDLAASSPAPMSTNFAAPPIRSPSRPRSRVRMR